MEEKCGSSVCIDCGMRSEGCCVNTMVLLTIEDIERICSKGFRLEDFATVRDCIESDPFCEEEWWKNAGLRMGGRLLRATIKRNGDGSCIFLRNGKGCILGDKRPAICRAFPMWVDGSGSVACDEGIDYCIILDQNRDAGGVLNEIGEKEQDIKEQFNMIRQDCLLNSERHARIAARLLVLEKPAPQK